MNSTRFKESIKSNEPPYGESIYLQALWFDAKENWQKAHELIQDVADKKAAWIHAYLHRKEGDNGNADYWYYKAGKKRPSISLAQEWEELLNAFIQNNLP